MVSCKAQKWYRTALVGLALSVIVETTQLITSRGFFEIDDMILNTLGTVLGYSVWETTQLRLVKKRGWDEY